MAKMKIFVSWSGPRSAAVAEALKEYLPIINNAFEPWLSSLDIPKGSRSTTEIAEALVAAKAGIICLTPTNLNSPWILYEAGGIAKTVDRPLACTVLIGLEPSDVSKPLGDFQHTRLLEKELLHLMKTINAAAGGDARQPDEIDKAFRLCWPELKDRLDNLPAEAAPTRPKRSDRELLEDIVDEMRHSNSDLTSKVGYITVELQRSLDLFKAELDQLRGQRETEAATAKYTSQQLLSLREALEREAQRANSNLAAAANAALRQPETPLQQVLRKARENNQQPTRQFAPTQDVAGAIRHIRRTPRKPNATNNSDEKN